MKNERARRARFGECPHQARVYKRSNKCRCNRFSLELSVKQPSCNCIPNDLRPGARFHIPWLFRCFWVIISRGPTSDLPLSKHPSAVGVCVERLNRRKTSTAAGVLLVQYSFRWFVIRIINYAREPSMCVRWSNEAATVHADIMVDNRDVPAHRFFGVASGHAKNRTRSVCFTPHGCRNLYFYFNRNNRSIFLFRSVRTELSDADASFLNSAALLSSQVKSLTFFAGWYTPRPNSESLLSKCGTSKRR